MIRGAYIDVRGPWPTYVNGMKAITLHGCRDRGISVEHARIWIATFTTEVL